MNVEYKIVTNRKCQSVSLRFRRRTSLGIISKAMKQCKQADSFAPLYLHSSVHRKNAISFDTRHELHDHGAAGWKKKKGRKKERELAFSGAVSMAYIGGTSSVTRAHARTFPRVFFGAKFSPFGG